MARYYTAITIGLLSATTLASPALAAQETTQPVSGGTSATVAAPQTTAEPVPDSTPKEADSAQIEDIIVTARRFDEALQETPVAVTAFTGEDLVNSSIVQISDLEYQTPSLNFGTAIINPSAIYLAMRGQVVIDARLQNDNAVGIYVDGVSIPRNVGIQVADLFDVQLVEVLKGPQGTLYGRNTTGGALKISNKAPVQHFEGLAQVRAGNHGVIDIAGMINIPLSDTLALRMVGERHDRKGYGVDVASGDHLGSREGYNIRGALKWEPSSSFDVTLRGSYGEDQATSSAWRTVDMVVGSGGNALVAILSGLNPTDPADLITARDIFVNERFMPAGSDFQDSNFGIPSLEQIDVWSLSGTINWHVTDQITLTSITAGWGFDRFGSLDFDGTPFPILGLDSYTMDDRQFSQEVTLSGRLIDNRLNLVTGVFYADEEGNEFNSQTSLGPLNPTNPGIIDGDVFNKSLGLYGQVDFAVTESLGVFGGIRYTEDKRAVVARNQNARFCTTLGIPLAALGSATCERKIADKFSKISYTAGARYEVTPDIMVYAKTSRGYRSGVVPINGGGTTPESAAATFESVQPELITDYEAGIKTDLFNRTVRANLAYYHSNYSDIQRTGLGLVPGTSQIVNVLSNAAKAEIDGVELELAWKPFPSLEFRGTGAYTNARFTEYVDPVTGVDLTHTPFQFTPEFSFSLSMSHEVELPFGELRTQVDFSWDDELYGTVQNGIREDLGLLNARVNLHIDDVDLDVALFAKNITDEKYFSSPLDLTDSPLGYQSSPVGAPRSWGVELRKAF